MASLMVWQYIVITLWGDVLGSNSREDVDLALRYWRGSIAIDCSAGSVLGGAEQIEEVDVTRYRHMPAA